MSVESTRELLQELEREAQAESEIESEIQKELAAQMKLLDEAARAKTQRKHDILTVRRQLEREEALANAAANAKAMSQEQSALQKHFEAIAGDKPWFVGTGNDDAVLEHQMVGAMFGAVAKRWILGDAMGLGKTRTSIGFLDLVKARKVIVVCEANVCEQFAGEIMELAPHRQVVTLNNMKPRTRNGVKFSAYDIRHERIDALLKMDDAVVVVNYEIWRRDQDALSKLIAWQADTILVDEAHNLKTTSTANFKYVQMLVELDNTCPACGGPIAGLFEKPTEGSHKRVARPCERCKWKIGDPLEDEYPNPLSDWLKTRSVKNICFLTGTPLLNAPDDIYSLLHLIDPTLFKTHNAFLSTYCASNVHSGKWEFLPMGIENLKPLIQDRFLARSREDAGVVLPPQRVHIIPVELDRREYPKQWKVIRQITETAQILLESGEQMSIMHLIALLTRKRQANVWPGGIELKDKEGNVIFSVGSEVRESVKMDTIIDHVLALDDYGHRQVVFSQFKTALAEMEIRMRAEGLRVVRFDGDTPQALRTQVKNNFYLAKGEEPKWDVILANYKTGGTGLNLTSATKVHILDEEWNGAKRDQAYARVTRMGQTKECDVYIYRIPHSIDTWMSNLITRKDRMVSQFSSTMKSREDDEPQDIAESLLEAMRSGELL